ncbi:hypothetical protein BTI679_23750 [Bacillus wiedmannii]|nr:hypothetical protein BTI679_23750 [Bacillus wiedmannii]
MLGCKVESASLLWVLDILQVIKRVKQKNVTWL